MRLSLSPCLRCICQSALCCCTRHGDGTPVAQQPHLRPRLSKLGGRELAKRDQRKNSTARAGPRADSWRSGVRSLANPFARLKERQDLEQLPARRVSCSAPWLQQPPAPTLAVDILSLKAPCLVSTPSLPEQRGARPAR